MAFAAACCGASTAACSSSNENGGSSPFADGGGGDPDAGSTPSLEAGSGSDSGSTSDSDSGPPGGDSGAVVGMECCLGGTVGPGQYAPERCAPFGGACTNGAGAIPIACNKVLDCVAHGANGGACCLQGATGPAPSTTCPGLLTAKSGTAVVCEGAGAGVSTCAAGEVQLCSSAADCPAGTVCRAGKWKIFDIGFCVSAGAGEDAGAADCGASLPQTPAGEIPCGFGTDGGALECQ